MKQPHRHFIVRYFFQRTKFFFPSKCNYCFCMFFTVWTLVRGLLHHKIFLIGNPVYENKSENNECNFVPQIVAVTAFGPAQSIRHFVSFLRGISLVSKIFETLKRLVRPIVPINIAHILNRFHPDVMCRQNLDIIKPFICIQTFFPGLPS